MNKNIDNIKYFCDNKNFKFKKPQHIENVKEEFDLVTCGTYLKKKNSAFRSENKKMQKNKKNIDISVFYVKIIIVVTLNVAEWCNGSTADSDSVSRGSNPFSVAFYFERADVNVSSVFLICIWLFAPWLTSFGSFPAD